MKKIEKVSLELKLDMLTPMNKSNFTFPKETQFLGATLMNNSRFTLMNNYQLEIFYMAPKNNFKKKKDFEAYDFVVLNLSFHFSKIPDELEFFTTFTWEAITYGVFFRKC